MARQLSAYRTAVLQRADMANSTFISNAELNDYINQSGSELYDLLISARGQDYFEKTATFTTTTGQNLYPFATIAADFYQLIMVEMTLGGYTIPLTPYMRTEHGRYTQQTVVGGRTVTLTYIPSMTVLVNDTDTFDTQIPTGWDEYIITDAAIKCLQKEESDVSVLEAQKAALRERIERMAPNRDAGMPERVQDVTRTPFSPYLIEPRPRYRIRGANLDIVEGPFPRGTW